MIGLKNTKERNNLDIMKIKTKLRLKFFFFFLFVFLLLIFCWYYTSCFCAVYYNTQSQLMEDTIISFIISNIYPIFINLIPGTCRIPSLKEGSERKRKQNINKYLYILSKICQIFWFKFWFNLLAYLLIFNK